MPLIKSSSKEAIGHNIEAEQDAGKPHKQSVAIALSVARRAKERASGGRAAAEAVLPPNHQLGMRVPKGGSMCHNCEFLADPTHCGNEGFIKWNGEAKLPHADDEYCCDLYGLKTKARASGGKILTGPIRTPHGGRTDTVPGKVEDGGYVINADTISHMGQNNSENGLRIADHLFGPNSELAKQGSKYSSGGKAGSTKKPVDCVVAGGEYIVPVATVKAIGKGDLEHGHRILDAWMVRMRKDHIRELSRLPGPAQD